MVFFKVAIFDWHVFSFWPEINFSDHVMILSVYVAPDKYALIKCLDSTTEPTSIDLWYLANWEINSSWNEKLIRVWSSAKLSKFITSPYIKIVIWRQKQDVIFTCNYSWNRWVEKLLLINICKSFTFSKYWMSCWNLNILLISKSKTSCISFTPNKQYTSFWNYDWLLRFLFNILTFNLFERNFKRTICISLPSQRHRCDRGCINMCYEWLEKIIDHLRFFCVSIFIMSTT